MKPQISIIVPIYKAEAYIRRCLDSIVAQSFTDWEAILVDDGSPDRSGEICDEYARRDSRIRVIHQENKGVAGARQTGIDNAIGEYSIHCDPDDWVEGDWLECLYSHAKSDGADMVICDFFNERPMGQEYDSQKPYELTSKTVFRQLVEGTMHGSTCNKLLRTRLYKDFNITFPLNMVYCEDLFVICQFLSHDIKVGYVPKALYHYDKMSNSNSLSSTVKSLSREAVDSLIYFTDYVSELRLNEDYQDVINDRKCYTKSVIWYSQHYSPVFFRQKYSEIDNILRKHCKEEAAGQTKSLQLALYGWGGVILATLIEKTRKFR